MSSASPSSQISTTRNPRRRQRNSTEDLPTRQQQPQRKRHKAAGDEFKSAATGHNGDGGTYMNGHTLPKQNETVLVGDVPIRGKQAGNRALKDESGVVLTQNMNYNVKQLPSLPDNIRQNKRENYRGTFLASTGLALALTRTQAFVWDYTSSTSSPSTRVFTLQHPSKQPEPLPLGFLVAPSAGSETGLVVINATTGKIVYWESVENADALSLFEQRRNGIVGSCGTLLAGETLSDVTESEPTGFILRFSSGRTAQLLLRDAQSRPSISVHFLDSERSKSSGSFFGGLRNVFGGSYWQKNVIASRTRVSDTRGYTDAVVVGKDAQFQIWQLSWTGQAKLQYDVDAKLAIEAATTLVLPHTGEENNNIIVVDFAISPTPQSESKDLIINGSEGQKSQYFDLVVLVEVRDAIRTMFALVEVELTADMATARRTIPLHSYKPPNNSEVGWRPRLFLPGAANTAFTVFEAAVVLVSLATVKVGADAQILMDVHKLPEPFQDTLYFKVQTPYKVVGASSENSNEIGTSSSIVLLVERFGLIRVTAAAPTDDEFAVQRSRISAKSQFEQAVYFGSAAENPLDLLRKPQESLSLEEVEEAALNISQEVLSTTSPFLSTVAPSMEFHLEQRARILKHLILYLKQYDNTSRLVRWKLLWDAERMAAARKLWFVYNDRVSAGSAEVLLPKILFLLEERFKTLVDPESGERDRVRQYFLKDLGRMDILIAAPPQVIKYLHEEKIITDARSCLEYLSDGCNIVLACLDTAFKFRAESAALYGLENENMKEGLLQTGYEGLPEFWTSSFPQQKALPGFISFVREKLQDSGPEVAEELKERIRIALPKIIDNYCKGAEERYRWYSESAEVNERAVADEFRNTYEKERSNMIRKLRYIGLVEPALSIAQKYHDMYALVVLVQSMSDPELLANSKRGDAGAKEKIEAIEKRVKGYFETYGEEWADVFYTYQLSQGAYSSVLDQATHYGPDLTRYLRASKSRKKLSWINDVVNQKDYQSAGETLLAIAQKQEGDLWSRKVELSLSKLALVASQRSNTVAPVEQRNALRLVKIQEQIYEHIRSSFYDAVDRRAELQLAVDAFGTHAVKGRPALQQLLERGLESTIGHSAMDVDQLIDVLTLMDQRASEVGSRDIAGDEMFVALKALAFASPTMDESKRELLLRFIFRRCFISDDWRTLDATARKSDQDATNQLESTTLFRTFYAGHASNLWHENSPLRVLTPADVLGAGTTPDEHRYRFKAADIREPIAKDMATEDGILQNYINKYRLAHWVSTAEEWAKEVLRREESSEAQHGEKLQRVVTQLEGENEDFGKYNRETGMPESGNKNGGDGVR